MTTKNNKIEYTLIKSYCPQPEKWVQIQYRDGTFAREEQACGHCEVCKRVEQQKLKILRMMS